MPYYRCPVCGPMSHSFAAYSTAGVCAVCSAELPDDAKLDVLPEARFGVNRKMRASPTPRRRRAEWSALCHYASTRATGLRCSWSELVTNPIRYSGLAAGDPIELEGPTRTTMCGSRCTTAARDPIRRRRLRTPEGARRGSGS